MSSIVTALCILLAINGVLLQQAWRYWREYKASQEWPRVETVAHTSRVQRVEFVQQSQPATQTQYEVTLEYRYHVGGRDYEGRTMRTVANREAAEALKDTGRVVLFYNPADPSQTVEAIAMPAKLKLTGFLLALVNAIGIWQITTIWAFHARGNL